VNVRWWLYGNAVATVAWLILGIPTLLWWKDDIAWVAWMSLYANFASHLACCMALLNERKTAELTEQVSTVLEEEGEG
jgi:hypothetical protein